MKFLISGVEKGRIDWLSLFGEKPNCLSLVGKPLEVAASQALGQSGTGTPGMPQSFWRGWDSAFEHGSIINVNNTDNDIPNTRCTHERVRHLVAWSLKLWTLWSLLHR